MMTLQSRITLSNDVLVQEVENEAVLLDLKSEQYFGLDTVGVHLWRALESDPSLESAHRHLLGIFEVESERLANDLIALLSDLEKSGLVQAEAA